MKFLIGDIFGFTLLHSERPKLYGFFFVFLTAIGLNNIYFKKLSHTMYVMNNQDFDGGSELVKTISPKGSFIKLI